MFSVKVKLEEKKRSTYVLLQLAANFELCPWVSGSLANTMDTSVYWKFGTFWKI